MSIMMLLLLCESKRNDNDTHNTNIDSVVFDENYRCFSFVYCLRRDCISCARSIHQIHVVFSSHFHIFHSVWIDRWMCVEWITILCKQNHFQVNIYYLFFSSNLDEICARVRSQPGSVNAMYFYCQSILRSINEPPSCRPHRTSCGIGEMRHNLLK